MKDRIGQIEQANPVFHFAKIVIAQSQQQVNLII